MGEDRAFQFVQVSGARSYNRPAHACAGTGVPDQAHPLNHPLRRRRAGRHDRPPYRAEAVGDSGPASDHRQSWRCRRQCGRRGGRQIAARRLHPAHDDIGFRSQCHALAQRRIRCRPRLYSGGGSRQAGQPDFRTSRRGGQDPHRTPGPGQDDQTRVRVARQRHHAASDGGEPVQPGRQAGHDSDSFSRCHRRFPQWSPESPRSARALSRRPCLL